MAAEIKELVHEITELRLLIAAWSGYEDPELLEVTRKMRERVAEQLERLNRLLHIQLSYSNTIH